MRRASLLLPLLILADCGQSSDQGTTLTLNSDDGADRAKGTVVLGD